MDEYIDCFPFAGAETVAKSTVHAWGECFTAYHSLLSNGKISLLSNGKIRKKERRENQREGRINSNKNTKNNYIYKRICGYLIEKQWVKR